LHESAASLLSDLKNSVPLFFKKFSVSAPIRIRQAVLDCYC